MVRKVLSVDQVDQFITCGYTKVEQAFPAQQALAAQEFLWGKLETRGIKRDDRTTWTQPMVQISEGYDEPVFRGCHTDRLCDAVEDLVGAGRWKMDRNAVWGWWPVNFSKGADVPWDVPTGGWHWDGIHFQHTLDAPDQGLLLLCLFSEIGKQGGGTLVAEGSHQVVARFLHRQAQPVELNSAIQQVNAWHPWIHDLTTATDATTASNGVPARVQRFMHQATVDADGTSLRVVEAMGGPGDIYLCHPFLYHAASQNHAGRPRFMCNRTTPLKQHMNFNRPDGDYSPVEISIRQAMKDA